MKPETRKSLTEICYRHALELRSRILRENPDIQQDIYQDEFLKEWIEYSQVMLKDSGKLLNENDLEEFYDIMQNIEHELLEMPTSIS